MEITLSVRHGDVPDVLKEYAREQVVGLARYFARLVEADIVLDTDGHRSIAEVRLHTSTDTHFARDESGDMRTSIDAVVEKIRRQLQRHKGKLENHALPRDERERIYGEGAAAEDADAPDSDRAPRNWPRISPSEASAQLENSGEDVLVFVDAVDGVVKIARRDAEGAVSVEEAESFQLEEE